MDLKSTLRALTLELRRELEGKYDVQGIWQPGDLERRLAAIGVRRPRPPVPVDELPHLSADDREARRVVDAFLQSRAEAGQGREAAITEFVREAAYSWANRLLALRCMEARGLIDEVILQKDAYGGRSLQHQRLARKEPERCSGEDEGLLAMLVDEFARRAGELPLLFDPKAAEVALRPSVAALKRCIALLSGAPAVKGQEPATDEVFTVPDALGWTYQHWNTEEKNRVFEKVRTKKGAKIEGAEIVPATCIYTEPYMVKFLIQNSLGAMWMGMHPGSRLCERWEYYVRDADRAAVAKKAVADITFLDPACGSGHFLIEAFDLFYAMYLEEGALTDPSEICAAILDRNLYGIDIDERAVQIAALALVMKAKEKAPDFVPLRVNLVATNIRLPAGKEHLEAFLRKHPEDVPLRPALLAIFEGLVHADELGSLLQVEEPVDRDLRHLRDQQLERERRTAAGTLFGPREDEDWAAWKHDAIGRLRQQFGADVQEADLATAFFGKAASKGLSLVGLLARRYDVVAANPPYMGSKNMGDVLKRHVERHFEAGKRDLYSAFMLRCLRLAHEGGRVAMVTQQSWMFLRSFSDLRAAEAEKRSSSRERHFRGVLWDTSLELLAHLGAGAFVDIGGEVVKSVLFVLAKTPGEPDHRLVIIPATAYATPMDKAQELRSQRTARRHLQSTFRQTADSVISYWVPPDLWLSVAKQRRLASIAKARKGITTMANRRFVRWVWEAPPTGRWSRLTKSLPFLRWRGPRTHAVEWELQGARVKTFVAEGYGGGGWSRAIANADLYFATGCWCSIVCGGNPSFRYLESSVFETKVIAIVPSDSTATGSLLAYLNTGLVTYLLRAMSPGLETLPGAVEDLPIPERLEGFDLPVCIDGYERLSGLSDQSLPYGIARSPGGRTWFECYRQSARAAAAVAAGVLCVEAYNENEAYRSMGISETTRRLIEADVGCAVGLFPLIRHYDAVCDGIELPPRTLQWLDNHERVDLSPTELASTRSRLAALYSTSGASSGDDAKNVDPDAEIEEEDTEVDRVLQRRPLETSLEALSMDLRIHPLSVHQLLQEATESSDLRCPAHERRFAADQLSAIVLRVLGHRWPSELETSDGPVRFSKDKDGIVVITGEAKEESLYKRVRERIAREYSQANPSAIERDFVDTIGKSLEEWLATDFFTDHITQFRRRPIAWQLETTRARGASRGRSGPRSARRAPTFSCLVYYHQLDIDLLPKLRTHYVGPLRTSLETELGGLEKLADRSADQDARRLELEEKIEELRSFDVRLEEVAVGGFASLALESAAATETFDKWSSRDGWAPAPASRDAFLVQERRYDPDVNDGVRVNIAPLQRAGLLAADVLAGKEVEKAIADRAEWRADERRWCREGKLPRPGWWRHEGTT